MAMGMLSTQILTSKYHSSLKGIQEILKEMVNSRLGSEKYKSAYESKNDLKKKKKGKRQLESNLLVKAGISEHQNK